MAGCCLRMCIIIINITIIALKHNASSTKIDRVEREESDNSMAADDVFGLCDWDCVHLA